MGNASLRLSEVLYDKQDFPFLDGDIPRFPSYGVYILFTKSRGYSKIKNYNIYQMNVINLKQLVLISKVISQSI